MLLLITLLLPIILWWVYQYLDWRNDIFQVTPDQILDIDKKPFGSEERRAAPLENILAMYETAYQYRCKTGLEASEDAPLVDDLLQTNPAFRSLVAKSKAAPRKTFAPGPRRGSRRG